MGLFFNGEFDFGVSKIFLAKRKKLALERKFEVFRFFEIFNLKSPFFHIINLFYFSFWTFFRHLDIIVDFLYVHDKNAGTIFYKLAIVY